MVDLSDDAKEPYRSTGFYRSGVLRDILSEQALRDKVLGLVVHREEGPSQIDSDLEKIHGSSRLCAILLCIPTHGTLEMIPHFEEQFLGEWPCGKTDDDLPFDEYFAGRLFGSKGGTIFFNHQFLFAVVTLGKGIFAHTYDALSSLPYLENERIGSGAYGNVYRVKIEKDLGSPSHGTKM
jgi:hypothetical protein